jgi:hypothetical protein
MVAMTADCSGAAARCRRALTSKAGSERTMHRPTFSSRALISAAAMAGVAALAPALAAPASLAKGGSISAKPTCATSGLVVWLNTAANGAAGSIYYNLYFTNLSAHTCSLRGYPGVSAVDLFGRRVGRPARRESVQKPTLVTLPREATAAAVLRIVDAANFTASACREATAAGLRIYPPGQARSKVIPFPFKVCARGGVDVLSVRALTPKP